MVCVSPSCLPFCSMVKSAEGKYFTLGGCCGPVSEYFSLGGCGDPAITRLPTDRLMA